MLICKMAAFSHYKVAGFLSLLDCLQNYRIGNQNIGSIGVIETTTVFPSPRPSERVPFGTGRRVLRFMTGGTDEYRLYDSRIFAILREWPYGSKRAGVTRPRNFPEFPTFWST